MKAEDVELYLQATCLSLAVGLYQAAESVAHRYRLHSAWLNTIRVGALQPRGVDPPRRLWKKYQVLEVFFPEAEYVLIQKLLVNRRKDRQDILVLFRTLGIATRSQAEELLGRYISLSEQERQRMEITLDSYFST